METILNFQKSTVEYIQSSRFYSVVEKARDTLQQGITKVIDTTLPRNPVTQHRELRFIPVAVENALGAIYYNDVCPKDKIAPASDITEKVSGVFDKLINQCARKDELKFEVRVMQDDKTVNAFCLPGGKVVITTALLKKLMEESSIETSIEDEVEQFKVLTFEDKLAAVLGHEISHACAGHGRRSIQLKLISFLAVKATAMTLGYFIQHREELAIHEEKAKLKAEGTSMTAAKELELLVKAKAKSEFIKQFFEGISNVIKYFSTLNHSRCHELEADKYGIKIAVKAGYKPEGAIWLQHKFLEMKGEADGEKKSLFMRFFSKSLDLFSTHPPSQERLDANRLSVQTIRNEGVEAIYPKA